MSALQVRRFQLECSLQGLTMLPLLDYSIKYDLQHDRLRPRPTPIPHRDDHRLHQDPQS
jgi:hypothetical protein